MIENNKSKAKDAEKNNSLQLRINELEGYIREINHRLKAAEAATETTKILSSEMPLNTKLQNSLFIILEHINADKGSLMLVDTTKGDELVVVEAATKDGLNPNLVGKRQKIGDSVASWVVQNKRSLLIEDITKDPRFKYRSGTTKSYGSNSFLSVPLMGDQGKVIGVLNVSDKRGIGIFTEGDIGSLILFSDKIAPIIVYSQLHEELKRKNDELLELQRLKEDLTSMIVHDLKGPLGEIMSNLDILTYNQNLSSEDREVLDTSIQGCVNLLGMVMNLLDISKMEEGKMRLNREEFNLSELIQGKIKNMNVLAIQKEVRIKANLSHNTILITSDKEIVERIIANLINNAIAYSFPKKEIEVEAGQEGDFVKISVKDEGKGIPREFHEKIFEKFSQRTEDGVRRRSSTGLGLTFCKMAVEAHGGKIWVESEEEKGSTFSFTLPMKLW
ncbi:MAG: GAF domain-containing protein [Nitrospinae bacterium]|nr:GAF domain-containing protein [Nitrospinota bacterium]